MPMKFSWFRPVAGPATVAVKGFTDGRTITTIGDNEKPKPPKRKTALSQVIAWQTGASKPDEEEQAKIIEAAIGELQTALSKLNKKERPDASAFDRVSCWPFSVGR